MPIPLVDLKAQLTEIGDEVRAGWDAVLAKTAFILGPDVAELEKEYAAFCGSKYAIGVANGTDALELAMRAIGLGPGDEAIVPANTFIATALAVARTGAKPVLCDVDPVHQLIDPDKARAVVTSRTKAIVPVHLFGQCAPMEAIDALAKDKGLVVIEDAAQSQGAERNGKRSGALSLVSGTSFYPGKNLGAFGDAGAVTTSDDGIAKKIRALRNYGSEVKYHHPETGFNSRLDTLQAVVLRAKLKRLDKWNAQRRVAAERYESLLAGVPGVVRPSTLGGNTHVWHLYVVRVGARDAVLKKLNDAGIGAGIHYPVPVHLQGAFAHLGHKDGDFPVSEKAAKEILSLPMFPEITPAQQEEVVGALRAAL